MLLDKLITLGGIILICFIGRVCLRTFLVLFRKRPKLRIQLSPAQIQNLMLEKAQLVNFQTTLQKLRIVLIVACPVLLLCMEESIKDATAVWIIAGTLVAAYLLVKAMIAPLLEGHGDRWRHFFIGLGYDLWQRRIWEIEDLINAAGISLSSPAERFLPKYFWASVLLPVVYPLSPIALTLAILGYRDATSREMPIAMSVGAICWCAFWILILLSSLISLLDHVS